jgi:hypothetical protein
MAWSRTASSSRIVGDLPPQFERDALHRFGPVAHDRFANANRPCERDLGDIGIAHQFGADEIPAARDHVQQTLWEIRLVQRLDQHSSLERAQLAGLNDDRTTGGDGRGEL